MRVTQAFRFELDPNALQREALSKHIGAALIVAPRSFPSHPPLLPVRGLRVGGGPGPECGRQPAEVRASPLQRLYREFPKK